MDPTNLFDTQFVVNQIDPDGKKFDRGESHLLLLEHSLNSSDEADLVAHIFTRVATLGSCS